MKMVKKSNVLLYKRNLDDVDGDTLSELYDVEEGWFYEFKSLPPDTSKIARSVSSFANAYGGVIVFGVTEVQKTRKLSEIIGFSLEDAEILILKIRQAVESHLTPCPFYVAGLVKINDVDEKYVVWVKIESGGNGPYLHSSGVVYVRKGDSSSPVALNDIGQIERMWRNRQEESDVLAKRIEYLHSITHKSIPRLELFILDDKMKFKHSKINFLDFKKVAFGLDAHGSRNLFDTSYQLDTSYVARLINRDLDVSSILWDFDYIRGLHHIRIPLGAQMWDGSKFKDEIEGSEKFNDLSGFLKEKNIDSKIFLVDFTPSLGILLTFMSKLSSLAIMGNNSKFKMLVNFKISGVKSSMPYIRLKRYYEELSNDIIPYVYREVDFMYPLNKPTEWLELSSDYDEKDKKFNDIENTAAILYRAFNMVGFSRYAMLGVKYENSTQPDSTDLAEAIIGQLTNPCSFALLNNPSY